MDTTINLGNGIYWDFNENKSQLDEKFNIDQGYLLLNHFIKVLRKIYKSQFVYFFGCLKLCK